MTIASATNKSGPYFYNGSATSFAYGFKISNEAHIRVVETVTATGVETDLVLNTDYTVTGVDADAGGNVVISPARAAGKSVVMVRNTPFTQGVVLENQGAYFAKVVEGAFDDAAARDQQLQEQISRAVLVPVSAGVATLDQLVAGILALEPISASISTVSGISTQVVAVAANATNVNTVAVNISSVNTAAANMATIIAVPALATQVAADRVAVAADKATVAADKATVAGNTTTTTTNAGLTAADRVQTGLDRVQTAADRVQTGLDRIAAAASAGSIALPATTAALNYLRRNAGDTAYEVRTPTQVAADIGVVFTKEYVSAEQTITAAGLLTLTHGLGAAPKFVTTELICKTAEFGYAVGDVIAWGENPDSYDIDASGHSIVKTSTQLKLRFGSAANVYSVLNFTTGGNNNITPSSWRLIVRALA